MRKNLGCLTPVGLLAVLITAFSISGIVLARGGILFSPGALNAFAGPLLGGVSSHADTEGECGACHTAPWSNETMTGRCLACHADIQAEISDPNRVHGALKGDRTDFDCRACHTEHKGPDAAITRLDEATFPHPATGFSLVGHARQANGDLFRCQDCHTQDLTRLDPAICGDCHGDLNAEFTAGHTSLFGENCLACHDGLDSYGSDFDHNQTDFALVEKHAPLECQLCHAGATSRAALQATPADCAACHAKDDEHQGQMGDNCAFCHSAAGWEQVNFDHSKSGIPLDGQHASLECTACHQNHVFKGTPRDCVSCHAAKDTHQGRFGADCAACHTTQAWQPPAFNHATSAFPLTGLHSEVKCESCHTNRSYKGTSTDCASCHLEDDAHEKRLGSACAQCHTPEDWKKIIFDHNTADFQLTGGHLTAKCTHCHTSSDFASTPHDCVSCHKADDNHNGQLGANCERCHTTDRWSNITFNHSQTSFALSGAHSTANCTQCHTNSNFTSTPKDCIGCHKADDRHNGQYGANCVRCHTTDRWSNITFNHSQTHFALTGAHSAVQCTQCHTNGSFSGTPKDCISCHKADDRHNGQFGTSCERCHTTDRWGNVTFNHNQTRFALTGAHLMANCSTCHAGGSFSGTPTRCIDCHRQDDRHNGQFGTDCQACHTTDRWGNVTFNHNQTRFPLEGSHAGQACSSCHSNGQYKGTPADCVACHAGDDKHGGQYGRDCASCHNPSRWSDARFDHALSGFPLTGKHSGLACQQCHSSGQYSGLAGTCSSCHSEPASHAGAFGTDCASCHSTNGWLPAAFNGNHTFPMNHGKANTCGDCHRGSYTAFTCYNCHNQAEIEKKHNEKNLGDFSNCMACHADGEKHD